MNLRYILSGAAVLIAAAALGSCATMNEEQCLAGDWSGQGYSDGAAGHGWGRLQEHRKACEKHGVVPDEAAYYEGHGRGIRTYCRPARGYRVGKDGGGYSQGFCPADLEPDFMTAYADGRLVYAADQRVTEIQNRVNEAYSRARSLESEINSEEARLSSSELTDEERQTIRSRIRRLRDDRERELYDARDLERDVTDAQREADETENRFVALYGT